MAVSLIPSLPDDVVKGEIFPFLQKSDLIRCKRINKNWKEVIDADPKWEKMAKSILGRGIEINLQDSISCQKAVMQFCAQVDRAFPNFFPKGPRQIINELPKALETLSTQIAIPHGLTMSLRMATTPYVTEENSKEEIDELLQKANLAKVACSQSDKEICLELAIISDERYVPRVISSLKIENIPASFLEQVVDYCPQHLDLIRSLVKRTAASHGSE